LKLTATSVRATSPSIYVNCSDYSQL